MRCFIWFIMFLLPVSKAWAHNWYFDTSLQGLNRTPLQPGDTIFLRGGVIFPGPLRLPDGAIGRAQHPIVITSYGLGRAVIDGGNGSAVTLYKASYIMLFSLELRGAGRKDGNKESGLVLNSCQHITARDLLVDGFQKSGVYIYRSSYIQILSTMARDNGYAGIAVEGPYGTHDCDHILIKDCRVENNPGDPTNLSNHSGNGIVA
ncbi:MAG TPA: right-handed parallel beta-helix repeat-containing protein, partial [Puia sp.]